jgi:hypothetical protein
MEGRRLREREHTYLALQRTFVADYLDKDRGTGDSSTS